MHLKIKFSNIIFWGLTILLTGIFLAGGVSGTASAFGHFRKKASLRVMHASPDAPPVDILVDNRVVFGSVPYKTASPFLKIKAGKRNIKVNVAGTSMTVIDADIDFPKNSFSTIIAVDFLSQINVLVLPDTNSTPSGPNLKIRVAHGSPSAPEVDVYVTAPGEDLTTLDPTIENLAFFGSTDFLEIPQGNYQIRVTPTGLKTVIYDSGTITLSPGSILTAVAVNSTSGKSIIGLVALTNDPANPSFELPDTQAQLRLIHASPDAPNVDVLVDDAIVLSDVAFKQFNQDYLAVDAGEHNIKVNAAGTVTSVIDINTVLAAGTDYTVLAVGFLAEIEPLLLIDDNTHPSAGKAKVRVIHASPDAPNVDVLVDDNVVLVDVPFKGFSPFLEVDAGGRNFKVNSTGTATSVIDVTPELEDGGVYLVIAVNQLDSIEVLLIKTN
jgi:hypothetical protein